MNELDHLPFLLDFSLLIILGIQAFCTPRDIVYSTKRIECEDDEICWIVKQERKGCFQSLKKWFQSTEQDTIEQNWYYVEAEHTNNKPPIYLQ